LTGINQIAKAPNYLLKHQPKIWHYVENLPGIIMPARIITQSINHRKNRSLKKIIFNGINPRSMQMTSIT